MTTDEVQELRDNLDSARLAVKWVVDHEHRAHEYDRPYAVMALDHIEAALGLIDGKVVASTAEPVRPLTKEKPEP